jgi:hypothetical protein
MKSKVTFVFISIFLILSGLVIPAGLQSQTVPNSGFEDWTTISFFEEPSGYLTTNFQSYLMLGEANVSKTIDACSGNYAVKLETVGNGTETIPGGIFIGIPGSSGIAGGIPYTGHPSQVSFCMKHNLNQGDTGAMMIIFKSMGIPVGTAYASFYDSSANYENWVVDINWLPILIPDSVMFVFFSSMPDQTSGSGSVVYLDNIVFVGSSQQLPNNDFENWENIASEEPDFWFTSNTFTLFGTGPSIEKSTDAFEGNYSVQITNQASIGGDTMSFITNGQIGENGPSGGSPVLLNPDYFSFYYKYSPVGPDTALAMGILWRNDGTGPVVLDSVIMKLPAQASWTFTQVQFNYPGLPPADTVTIAFAAGNMVEENSYLGLGSELKVDNVEVVPEPFAITDPPAQFFSIYPNPAIDNIIVGEGQGQTLRIQILTVEGNLIRTILCKPGSHVDIADLQPGCYLYQVLSGTTHIKGKFIKIH